MSPSSRRRFLNLVKQVEETNKLVFPTATKPSLIRRAEVARRMSCSIRMVDKLAAAGLLRKRKLPGRVRASGFLESDVSAFITGGVDQ